MRTHHTPADAVAAVLRDPHLPDGTDERFTGFGVMGLPFSSGHYLAFRHFLATSFSPAYRSVWHRDPQGRWIFYATTPAQESCSRYFSTATAVPAVQCDIEMGWPDPWTLEVAIAGLLRWTVGIRASVVTTTMSRIGSQLPERLWDSPTVVAAIGRVAGTSLRAGRIRLAGNAPNGQRFRLAPRLMWEVADSRAVIGGHDIGTPGPLATQARLGDFRLPQRGVCVVGSGRFDTFDPTRHRHGTHTASDCLAGR
jgi:hypothetical protein